MPGASLDDNSSFEALPGLAGIFVSRIETRAKAFLSLTLRSIDQYTNLYRSDTRAPPRMLIAKEFIQYLAREIVKRLHPSTLEVSDSAAGSELIAKIIEDDLAIEDRLNDEVREILSEYTDYMRKEGVSYQEMFRRIKNQLVRERKVIRASGRDTGDQMKISRDKVTDLSHKLVTAVRKERYFRVKKQPNDVRLEVVKAMTELLVIEDKVDRAARQKIRTQKRDIPEGSEEWDLLHRRYYAEELKRFGIDLTR